uniref:CD248 molecule, endosialin b n=1 Tax=Oryzias latipes TaxID=8090 RepID=A0A3P9ITD1_ORYLA
MQKIIRSCSSCRSTSFLCILWLLTLYMTSKSHGQNLSEADGRQPAASAQMAEKDAVCYQGGCYAVFLQKRVFRDAGRSCRERGGTLATMHNQEEAGVVHELLNAMEAQGSRLRLKLWIGLHRLPRQCSAIRPLRGFVWVKGDQDGQFTNWLREESSGTCAAHRCVAMNVNSHERGKDGKDNFRWIDGSCTVPVDGFVCQFNYRGMCSPLEAEGSSLAVYTTPFGLESTILTHVPHGSVATIPCTADSSNPHATADEEVLCIERDDMTVSWNKDGPVCLSSTEAISQDMCSYDHGCEHYCETTDTSYNCYCSEGFVLNEDGYSCIPDPVKELSSYLTSPTHQPHIKEVCLETGCEYDCRETPRGVRCTCPNGFQISPDGRKCSDVDECLQQPCSQLCVNIPATFHCTCHQGYQQDDDGECIDVDECLDESTCDYKCENTVGSFKCHCPLGYELNSVEECADVDECAQGSPCQQTCLNYAGGYSCDCVKGFVLQSDGTTCHPYNSDGEYSTLTPDPTDSTDPDFAWSSVFTTDSNFEADSNFNVEWLTETTKVLSPDMVHGSDNHLSQWNDLLPGEYQTSPSPTQKDRRDNEIQRDENRESKEPDDVLGAKTGKGAPDVTGEVENNTHGSTGYTNSTADFGAESAAGKLKHDKGWLLVALLVPLCVFLVVMLALGIVYCTSCAVDKSLSFSDCYRWVLPTTPPTGRDEKNQA